MSRHGAIELDWADGKYTFRLSLGLIEELEDKCDCGIYQIFERVSEQRTFRLKNVSETLRLGLIGGGVNPVEALQLVNRYVDERPIEENRDIAFAVILAGLGRVHGDEILKQTAEEADAPGKPKAAA